MSSTVESATKIAAHTMKAIRKAKPEAGFELATVEKPVPGPGEVLIKVLLASICGTDFHITNWDEWSAGRIKPPLVYGHEFCGVIESVGEDEKVFQPGDYVSAEMHLPCDRCQQCLNGRKHTCEQVKIFGIDLDGCYAEYIKLPAKQVIKLPESIKPEYGALLDSLGNSVHAVSRADVAGKTVHVAGCGPLGLFAVQVAHAMGALKVFASDIAPFRLDLARKAGADYVFSADQGAVSEEIKRLTQGHGVDVVLEMSGSPAAINDAFKSLKLGGTVVMMGIPKNDVAMDLSEDIIFKEAQIIGVNGRQIFETWFLMLDLMAAGKLDLDFIITHRLKLEDFGQAMDLIAQGVSGKILLEP
ncbi:MAG TPA: L-threonine 3-dehydrogenase [Coleofasciculaceae cyanobacterium]|jgi:threonine 3-dehydrogenase